MENTINLTNEAEYKERVKELIRYVQEFSKTEINDNLGHYQKYLETQPEFTTAFPERAEVIRNLLIDAQWVALPVMSTEVVVELLNKHLMNLFTLTERYDFSGIVNLPKDIFNEELRSHLLTYHLFDDRDKVKQRLVTALLTNDERITSAPFFEEIKQAEPTLRKWFEAYTAFMVPGAKFSQFQQSKFFKTNDNVQALSDKELQRLHLIIDEYEQLKRSSWTEEGMEESIFYDDGEVIGMVQYGRLIPFEKEDQERIRKAMEHEKQQEIQTNASNSPVPRPPVDFVHARPTVHPDIEGVDIDATKGPDHFSEQDAADIEKHIAKSGELTAADTAYHKQAEDLKHHLQIVFQTPEVEKKFTDLLVSVLRGLRDVMELRGYLEDLRYSKEQIEPIASAIKEILSGKTSSAKQVSATPVTDGAVKPSLSQIQSQMQQSTQHTDGQVDVESATTTTETSKPQSVLRQILLPKLRRSRKQRKPIIDDVKLQQSMVMGPLDELKAMDLIEFRRLSPDPAAAAMKLKDKVDLLGEEAVSKQADGIKAFKQSPINLQYLDIGNKSMMTGKPVADIIQELQVSGTPVLSVEEFNAIADLNKRIRF